MIHFLADSVITPLLPFFLGLIAIILYSDLKFFPFLKIRRNLSSLFSSTDSSSWKALSVALAGTLGVGNIVGVAYAITTAGAGALFWMWASALLAMILKYGETLLAIKYRKNISQSKQAPQYIGGAMYYIPNRTLAAMFAILCIASSFTVGNLLQTKAVSDAFALNFSLSPYLVGTMLAILTLFVIWRGIRRITQFCSVVIPFLSLIYLLMCIAVLLKNASSVPSLFTQIVTEAFSLRAVGGGIGGTLIFHAMKVGFSKGLITNEAGCGTAPIAHASANTDSAVKQGLLGVIEVFFDTIVLCTASGLVLLLAQQNVPALDGYALVLAAFEPLFGRIADIILPLCIFFFVLATLVSWSYYGKSALTYFTQNRAIQKLYLLLFSVVAFFGAVGEAGVFWQLSDITLGLMTFINAGYLLYFRRDIQKETQNFLQNNTHPKAK